MNDIIKQIIKQRTHTYFTQKLTMRSFGAFAAPRMTKNSPFWSSADAITADEKVKRPNNYSKFSYQTSFS